MLRDRKLMAFCPTRDGARARRFYEQVLDLPVLSDDDFAVVVDAHGTALRLQRRSASGRRPVARASPGSRTRTGICCR